MNVIKWDDDFFAASSISLKRKGFVSVSDSVFGKETKKVYKKICKLFSPSILFYLSKNI